MICVMTRSSFNCVLHYTSTCDCFIEITALVCTISSICGIQISSFASPSLPIALHLDQYQQCSSIISSLLSSSPQVFIHNYQLILLLDHVLVIPSTSTSDIALIAMLYILSSCQMIERLSLEHLLRSLFKSAVSSIGRFGSSPASSKCNLHLASCSPQ